MSFINFAHIGFWKSVWGKFFGKSSDKCIWKLKSSDGLPEFQGQEEVFKFFKKRKIREIQKHIFNFLEKPFQRIFSVAGFYHMASFLSVVVCLIVTIFSTIKGFEEVSLSILFYLESIILGELNSYAV